jgi:hypothetical protein
MAVEERQHEKRNALMVKAAGAAKMADSKLSQEFAVTTGRLERLVIG